MTAAPAGGPGPHTVGEIAKDLGRSADAVGNALTTLADQAEVGRLADKPIRYEANAATAAAAITPKAPPRPSPPPLRPRSRPPRQRRRPHRSRPP